MNVVFVSNTCDQKEYERIFNQRKKKMIDPMQKFMDQIISGVAENTDCVTAVSILPVSYSTMAQRSFVREERQIGNIAYIYPAFNNGLFSRFFTQFVSVFKEVSRIIDDNRKKQEEIVIVCDALCLQASMAARLAGKRKKVPVVAIVTDIPSMATKMKSSYTNFRQAFQNFYEHQTMREIKKYDGYINLVKEMDGLINPAGKPSVVIEGTVDTVHAPVVDSVPDKKIVLYAGGINKSYGLETLVLGFIQSDCPGAELHIYGDGAYVEELTEICQQHPQVKYKGVALNSQMVELESKATLLVNPRFSHEEYTFYSFPSKTLEYMSSGTPACSTRLRGIPADYENYLYWFDDESVEGMANTLTTILNTNQGELEAFGQRAKQFVDSQKNKYTQGRKIVDFCRNLLVYE